MPISPVRTPRIYHLVADQMKRLIQDGEYRPGDVLPPARALARQFRVSSGPVREALVALELLGILERRASEGWFVKRAPDPDSVLEVALAQGRSPSDVIQARVLIECAVIEQVALRRSAGDVALIRQAVEAFQQEVDRGQYHGEADRLFHFELARATGNLVFIDLIAYLWDLQVRKFYRAVEDMIGDLPARMQRYVADHQSMLVAISERDPASARERMRHHLEGVSRDLDR
jgi:GntR family uxuAB operon transcriptional repressor